jgi:hypothetical protein
VEVLEKQLKPSSLSSCSRDNLRALFLLTFETVFIVGLDEPRLQSSTFPRSESSQPSLEALLTDKEAPVISSKPRTLFDVLRTHLCQMIEHYMTFIGLKLGILILANPIKSLKVKDLTESLVLWKTVYFVGYCIG